MRPVDETTMRLRPDPRDDVATGIARHGDLDRMGASASGGLSATGVPSDTIIVHLFKPDAPALR